jgi:hypothetical protein
MAPGVSMLGQRGNALATEGLRSPPKGQCVILQGGSTVEPCVPLSSPPPSQVFLDVSALVTRVVGSIVEPAAPPNPSIVHGPFPDLSFSCMALHIIDTSVLLLRKHDILHCVKRFHQQLLQALTASPELRHAILMNDCRGTDGLVCREVLAYLSHCLDAVLIVREGCRLRCFGGNRSRGSHAVVITRDDDDVYRITEAAHDPPSILQSARWQWIQDQQLGHAAFSRMRKLQVQLIAESLGVTCQGNLLKKELLERVEEEVERLQRCATV